MSLTDAQEVFANVHETALNDFLTAFFTARPRHLSYGSPAFVPATTVAATTMPAIGFPGIPGGIQWRIRLSIPRVDLFKQSDALPPELSLGPGQFSLRVDAELCIECRRIRIDPHPPRPPRDQLGALALTHREDGKLAGRKDEKHPLLELTCFRLRLFAVGHLEHVLAATGEDAIALAVDQVEIVDIKPNDLESFLECLLFLVLQAVLAEVRLPLGALRAGAFALAPTVGPLIEDDRIKVRGLV